MGKRILRAQGGLLIEFFGNKILRDSCKSSLRAGVIFYANMAI